MAVYREIEIIIVDDDDGHAELIGEGLAQSGVSYAISRLSNGEELWTFLTGGTVFGKTRDSSHAYILLLDINMPKVDGIEILTRMKSTPSTHDIPVFMLTTTDDPLEIEHCYRLGCNAYITKPVDFTSFAETLRRLGLFLQIIKLLSRGPAKKNRKDGNGN